MQSLANGNELLNNDTVMPLNGDSIHPLTNVEDGYNINGADNLAQSDEDPNEFSPDIKEEIVDEDNDGKEYDIDEYLEADIDEMLEKERGEYTVCEKTVLKRRPKDLFTILPDNWVEATHDSGLVIYLKKKQMQKQQHQQRLAQESETNKDLAVMNEINAPLIKIKESRDVGTEDLSAKILHEYASKAFEFKKITYRRYKEWKKARKHFKEVKKLNADKANLLCKRMDRPTLPSDIKLITVPSLETNNKPTHREFCLNPRGKTALTILHEYVQKVLKSSIEYDIFQVISSINSFHAIAKIKVTSTSNAIISVSSFRERLSVIQEEYKMRIEKGESSNSNKPAEILKDVTVIGRGSGESIKAAKIDAARTAVKLLIPEIEFNKEGVALHNIPLNEIVSYRLLYRHHNLSLPSSAKTYILRQLEMHTAVEGQVTSSSSTTAPTSKYVPPKPDPWVFRCDNEEKELQLFDLLDIEDSKIAEYSHRTGQPQPFVILQECLAKSAPLANCQILTETQKAGHSKIEYRLKVGEKHEVIVTAISGNEGKQLAAQKMLKKISPQFTKYGSILRLYGSQVKQAMKDLKKEQKEFQKKISL
uniref:DRBM domain-containing protein n=1 Tax=Panagrolaimus davidi TaxID=227884 RepID=A0A914PU20_9BILA